MAKKTETTKAPEKRVEGRLKVNPDGKRSIVLEADSDLAIGADEISLSLNDIFRRNFVFPTTDKGKTVVVKPVNLNGLRDLEATYGSIEDLPRGDKVPFDDILKIITCLVNQDEEDEKLHMTRRQVGARINGRNMNLVRFLALEAIRPLVEQIASESGEAIAELAAAGRANSVGTESSSSPGRSFKPRPRKK